jgi:hypothetical protein
MGDTLKKAVQDGSVTQATLDDSVERILTQMYKFNLFENMNQWNGSTHNADVTSLPHSKVARSVSAASSVLLKNDGHILPLKPGTKIALIGADCVDPTVAGGGSGHVDPTYVISPYTAIATRNTGKIPASGPPARPKANCTVLDNGFDYFIPGSQQLGGSFFNADSCCQAALWNCTRPRRQVEMALLHLDWQQQYWHWRRMLVPPRPGPEEQEPGVREWVLCPRPAPSSAAVVRRQLFLGPRHGLQHP